MTHSVNIFKTSACIIFNSVLLAKTIHMIKVKLNVRKISLMGGMEISLVIQC